MKPLAGVFLKMTFHRHLSARAISLTAALLFTSQLFLADQAHALDAKAAAVSLAKTPMMKGLKFGKLAGDGTTFTTKLGSKNLPAVIFNTGSDTKPSWNVALYPRSLKLNSLYKTGGGAVLGGIILTNPAVVVSEKTVSLDFAKLPKAVQDGIKKVFGSSIKKVTYPAGVNFSFTVDVAKTPGLNLLRGSLGVADTKTAMAGQMGMDLVRYLASGKAATQAADLDKVGLTAALKAIKPPKISSYVNAKNMFAMFTGDAKGNVTLRGQTTLNIKVGKSLLAFKTGMAFQPKAKGADQNLITMAGAAVKLPASFGGHKVKSLNFSGRLSGDKKLAIGFNGELLVNKKPAKFAASLSFAKLPPQLALSIAGDQKVKDILGADVPGLGELPFKNAQIKPGFVSGTIIFRGIETPAVVIRSSKIKPVLALLYKDFNPDLYLPGINGSPLEGVKMRDTAMIIVPKGAARKSVAAKDLGGPLEATMKAAIGASAKIALNEGVNLIGAMNGGKAGFVTTLLGFVGVKMSALPFAGTVSSEILVNPTKTRQAAFKGASTIRGKAPYKIPPMTALKDMREYRAVAPASGKVPLTAREKIIVGSFDIGVPIPSPKIPGVSALLTVTKPIFHILGGEDAGNKKVKLTGVIKGTLNLKLAGKTLATDGSIALVRGTVGGSGNAIGVAFRSTSKIRWTKAFGIPFLTLNNVGLTGALAAGIGIKGEVRPLDNGKSKTKAATKTKPQSKSKPNSKKIPNYAAGIKSAGSSSINLGLHSEVKLGAQTVKTVTSLVIGDNELKNISLSIPGRVDVGKLPGLGKLPGMNEFAFRDITLSLRAIYGELTWKRLGITTKAAITLKDGDATAYVRVNDLKLGDLTGHVPEPFASIMFPATLLTFSTKPLVDMTLTGLPKPVRAMFDGIVTDAKARIPVFDGVTLIGALGERDFPKPLHTVAKNMGVFDALDGPLLLAGAIKGLFKGLPTIGLYADLPGLKLPKNQPLSRVVSFDKTKVDFFIRANVAATVFQMGAGGDLTIRVPHLDNPKKVDELTFRGEMYASVDLVSSAGGIKVGGQMKGQWRNPLGLNNFAFEDPAFVLGYDTEGSIEFGGGGTAVFTIRNGKKIRFTYDVLYNFIIASGGYVPKKIGVAGGTNRLSYGAMVEIADGLFRGVLTGPMASLISDQIPEKKSKDAIKFLQKELKTKSLVDLLHLDEIPLPLMEPRDCSLSFATPGAIIPGREKSLAGMGMFWKCKQHLALMKKSYLLGEMDIALNLRDGFKIYGKVPGLKLGPVLKYEDTIIDIAANLKSIPHFKFHGGAALFGQRDMVDVNLSKDGISFLYDKNFGPIKLLFHARTVGKDPFKSKDFVVTATAQDKLDGVLTEEILPKLGLPKIILDIVKRSRPLSIGKLAFEGSLTNFIKGKPVVMKITHKFFGDAVPDAVVEVSPLWGNPAKAIPQLEIAKAMTESFVRYMATHPIDVKTVNLGLIKVEDAKLSAILTNPAKPVFVLNGKVASLVGGASREVNVSLNDAGYSFALQDKIAGGLWDAKFRAWSVGGTAAKPDDIKYYGTLSSDFYTWLQKKVGGDLNRSFDGVDNTFKNAQRKLQEAQDRVNSIGSLIIKKRKEARQELENLRNLIKQARKALDHSQWLMDKAKDSRDYFARKHREARRAKWSFGKWIKVAATWALEKGADVAYNAAKAANAVQRAAFNGIDKGLTSIPLDLHPKVLPLIVARGVAIGVLQGAKLTFAGAEAINSQFKSITNALINAVAGKKVLVINKAVFTGSLKQAKADFHINLDILDQKNLFQRLKINLLNPADSSLRELAVMVTTLIKGEKLNSVVGLLPPPPSLPIATVSRKEIAAATVVAIRAEAARRAKAAQDDLDRQNKLSLSALTGLPNGGRDLAVRDHAGRCLDASKGRNEQLFVTDCNGGAGQQFTHKPNGQIVAASGLCVDEKSGKMTNGGAIILWTCNSRGASMARQFWFPGENDGLRSKNGLCVGPAGGKSARGAGIVLTTCASSSAQSWKFERPSLAWGKTVSMSSTYEAPRGDVKQSIDGLVDQRWKKAGGFARTNQDIGPWWRLDLGGVYQIDDIVVHRPTDCCVDQLNDARVFVSDWPFQGQPFNAVDDGILRARIGKAEKQNRIGVNRTGRYVMISMPRREHLTLDEVVVNGANKTVKPSTRRPPTNLALKRTSVRQSSTWKNERPARLAVDGTTITDFSRVVGATTDSDDKAPWWEVDLGAHYKIDNVRIHYRTDCCQGMLNGSSLLVSNEPFANQVLGGFPGDGVIRRPLETGRALMENAIGQVGRYVRIQMRKSEHLNIAEVEVLGDPKSVAKPRNEFVNLALNKSTRVSSRLNGATSASNGVDGRSAGRIVHTERDTNPWWEVDLGDHYAIDNIVIFNRAGSTRSRLRGARLMVSDYPFAENPLTAVIGEDIRRIELNGEDRQSHRIGQTGRYVRIQIGRRDFLHFNEVIVLAKNTTPVAPRMSAAAAANSPENFNARAERRKRTYLIQAADNNCLTVTNEKNPNRLAYLLAFQTCNSNDNQRFVYSNSDGFEMIRDIGGRCIDPQEDNGLYAYNCSAHDGKMWQSWKKELRNKQGRCITRSGATAYLSDCAGGSGSSTQALRFVPVDWAGEKLFNGGPNEVSAVTKFSGSSAFLFHDGQYIAYDIKADRAVNGYPRAVSSQSWPQVGFRTYDAAVNWGNGSAYLFYGNSYVRFNIKDDRGISGVKPINSANWAGLPFDRIDAAINWGNGKAYFFSGSRYVRYDIGDDRAEGGAKPVNSSSWPGMPFTNIDAAVNWGNGYAFFFSGDQYVKYDIRNDRAVGGAKPVNAKSWPGVKW